MANKTLRSRKLVELSNSGYEIVADEPDIRKWKVVNADGKMLGIVDELLVDRQLHKVRYIVLNLQGKPLNLLSRKILIPIGIVQLDGIDDLVILPNVTLEHLATLPGYKKGKLTIETERKIRNVFSPSGTVVDYDDDLREEVFYQHEHFNDSNLYSTRKKKPNRVGIVNEDAPGNHLSKSGFGPFQEGVTEISEKSEVPLVTKDVRVVEEIGVNKTVTERDEKVKDSVRKTEVEIENLDDSKP